MDGKSLLDQLRFLLRESTTSGFLDEKTSYDFLYEAALEFCDVTQCLHGTATITTVDGTSAYNLPADFSCLRIFNDRNDFVVKYNNGSYDSFIPYREWEAATYSNNTDEVEIPATFSVTDNETQPTNITGTATSTIAGANDEAVLTDTGATFTTALIQAGDEIHNTTDSSHGIVLAVNTANSLATKLFYGTNNSWTSADAYVIVPQGKKRLVVDPPSSTSLHTITVPYVQKPTPVYSAYRNYRFDPQFAPVVVKYAAWLYKYRDQEPNFGDAWYQHYQRQLARALKITNKSVNKTRFRINMIKRSLWDRSYR